MKVCEKCGGLIAYYPETFAGKPCTCISDKRDMKQFYCSYCGEIMKDPWAPQQVLTPPAQKEGE